MKFPFSVYVYTALPCEAKPLISRLRLKKKIGVRPFAIYCNNELCLTVTGLGKTAMAAGVAYTQALYAGIENPVLINLGVAGHQTQAIGTPFIGHKIIDADTGKKYYPVPAYPLPCASAAIVTGSRPQLSYDHEYLCDMESSAFYETACRFSTAELIQCLKIVSDNSTEPADGLDSKQVADLIDCNIGVLDALVGELSRLAAQIAPIPLEHYDRLIGQYRFTVTEQNQLKNLLLRWQVLADSPAPPIDFPVLRKGKDVLRWLERQLDAVEVTL